MSTTTQQQSRLARPAIVVTTVLAAVVINVIIHTIGVAFGGDFDFTNKGKTLHVGPGGVAFLTSVPLFVGMTLAALLSLKWRSIIKVALFVAPALALVTIGTMTIPADLDLTSTITLALTHVALVPMVMAGLLALDRHNH